MNAYVYVCTKVCVVKKKSERVPSSQREYNVLRVVRARIQRVANIESSEFSD